MHVALSDPKRARLVKRIIEATYEILAIVSVFVWRYFVKKSAESRDAVVDLGLELFTGEKFPSNLWGEKPYSKRVTVHVTIGTYRWRLDGPHRPMVVWHRGCEEQVSQGWQDPLFHCWAPGMSCIECVCARQAPGFAWSDGTSPATSTNSCSFRIIFLVGGTILPGRAAAASPTV